MNIRQHKKFIRKTLWPKIKELGISGSGDFIETSKEEMPNRTPDYYITLRSGAKVPVWEELTEPK